MSIGAKVVGSSIAAMVVAALCVGVCGCSTPPSHRYKVSGEGGRIRYSPERGIYREGEQVNLTEEELYRRGVVEFQEKDFEAAAETFRELRTAKQFVDGARALDAAVMESVSLLEAGRRTQADWFLSEMAGAWFDRDETYWRGRLPERYYDLEDEEKFVEHARLVSRGAINDSFEVAKEIFEFYPAGLGVSRTRLVEITRHMRNLAWLAGLAEHDSLAITIAEDLVKRRPRGTVEAQALLLLAAAQSRQGDYEQARTQYARIYQVSDNPDLQERALLGEVESLLLQSKGREYDRSLYDLANEKITEYKTDFLVQHSAPKLLREFAAREQFVNEVIWTSLKQAAADYKKLFAPESMAMAEARAEEFRRGAIVRERFLARAAGLALTGE